MNFLADENVDGLIVDILREAGYQVNYVREQNPGIDDEKVLALANEHQAILITEDKDFGELVYRLNTAHFGVILIRLSGWDSSQKGHYVAAILTEYAKEFQHAFTVISRENVRIRKKSG